MNTSVKICCISSIEEAELAKKYGASALGLVSQMPSGPGVITDDIITEIMNHIGNSIDTFLLTSSVNADEIISQHNKFKTTTLQLVDDLPETEYIKLKISLPDVSLVQVVHVTDETSIVYAMEKSKLADALLLDSGNPKMDVKELGGTGRIHNWNISKEIVNAVGVPVILAGGLTPYNVSDAIKTVNPYGVDLCSGVRTNGILDEIKLKGFFEAVNSSRS